MKKKEEQGVCESTETCNAVQSNLLYRQWELYALEQNKKDKKVSKKKRGSGNGMDEMTSTNRRDNSAFRQTDVVDGEVEKSLTSSSEERYTVMCGFYTTGPH